MGRVVAGVRGVVYALVVLPGLFIGCAFIGALASDVAVAQSARSAIVVEGNRRVETDTIRSYFRPGPSGRLDAVSIDEALKSLIATGLFQDVRISQPGGRIVVTVVENPVINRVAFEGNKKAKDEQLSAEVQSKPRGTLSRPTVQADVQRIIEIYRRSGRFDVRVEPKTIELPNNRVDLVFEVNEGAKTGVQSLNFVGNRAFSSSRLKEVIKTIETSKLWGFLQTGDIYDPDRVEADRDLLRRFYLKHGYADVRIVSAIGEYDPAIKAFVITFTIDEGAQYRVGTVDVVSNVAAIDPGILRSRLKLSPGSVYNAELVEKTVEGMSIEAAKRGFAFSTIRPRGDRNFETKTVNLVFSAEEGPRVYIERINVRGNTRTRDYVVRREFDIGEGDAYNRALIDRAERRLNNLGYFKRVKISNEPGSAPDRVVLNVEVEEQSTGQFSLSGGYSTSDGWLGEVAVGERNLLGRGQVARVALTYGQRTRGAELSFVEPYFLGYRMGAGVDVFYKRNLASNYLSYDTETIGVNLKLGFALTEELSFAPRYSIYQQKVTLPGPFNNCILPAGPLGTGAAMPPYTPHTLPVTPGTDECYADGEASLAVRRELANGPVIGSVLGYSLAYNTLDNNKSPTSGGMFELRQDFAGVGGDVKFIRTTGEMRNYYEVLPDVIGLLKLQAGHVAGWGSGGLRSLDHFQMGPNLVRGFAPSGFGPRDLGTSTQDPLGGSMFWGASAEAQTPLYFLPKEIGIKLAAFVDAGSLWDYKGPRSWSVTGETLNVSPDGMKVRAAAGIGFLWDSPLGPIRFDFAYPFMKQPFDRTQVFRFSGGTSF
ncbi:MAG: outer membrane protein assembly factor BamA [Pseudolabrys sp.]|nr:outer membrane protein assembly factor BamA [Pseudolabrys sp.]MBV9955312.1 outer membrane protein assembly factor BamA [Pseudolabrys sp.]